MPKFIEKPVVLEAVQWTGSNTEEMSGLLDNNCMYGYTSDNQLGIQNELGTCYAYIGDWIIKGVHNGFYVCKAETFEKTYQQI